MQLVIGNKNYSSWSLRPWLLLHACGLEFSEINVSLQLEGLDERLLQYSGSARVPVLIDNGLTIWDSLAICEYVSETYLKGRGWPGRPEDRAIARSITAEMHSGFAALRSELPMNCRLSRQLTVSQAVQTDITRIETIWSTHVRQSANGDLRLFGEFGIADCFYAPVVLRFKSYGVSLQGLAAEYAESLLEHPSVQRWVALAVEETEVLPQAEVGSAN